MEAFDHRVMKRDRAKSVNEYTKRQSSKLEEELDKMQREQSQRLRKLEDQTVKVRDMSQDNETGDNMDNLMMGKEVGKKTEGASRRRASQTSMVTTESPKETSDRSTRRIRRYSMPAVGTQSPQCKNTNVLESNNPASVTSDKSRSDRSNETISVKEGIEKDEADCFEPKKRAGSNNQLKKELQKIQPRSIMKIKNTVPKASHLTRTRTRAHTISGFEQEPPISAAKANDLDDQFHLLKNCRYIRRKEEVSDEIDLKDIFSKT